MKKRLFAYTLSLAMAMASLTACGGAPVPEAPTTEQGTHVLAGTTLPEAPTTEQGTHVLAGTTSAAGAETTEAAAQTENAENIRTARDYSGIYGSGRCTVRMQATSDSEMQVLIQWGNSAWSSIEWEMTAVYHPDSDTFTYTNAVKSDVTYADGGEESRTVLSENGCGTFRMGADKTMLWEDAEENAGEDMVFTYSPMQ